MPNPIGVVVDDEPGIRKLFTRILREAGIDVLEAESVHAAMTLLETARPDFVVTDIEMPDVDGVELCRRLRSHPAFETLQIIVVSGAGETQGRAALAAGCDAVLPKPCPRGLLLATIRRLTATRLHD